MAEPLAELRQFRLEKLENLKDKGIDPFPQVVLASRQKAGDLVDLDLNSPVTVAGRLRSLRAHGGSTFADLFDDSGKIQIFWSQELIGPADYQNLELIDLGDFLKVSGRLFRTQAGQLTINVEAYQLLTKSLRPLPALFYGLKDVEERYRQRYVDLLVTAGVRGRFEIRSQTVRILRRKLDEGGFLEVETPVLQNQYGGATAHPFITHHQALDVDLYLRISDELYLKRLIVGGFEKVYELSKDFRNEGIDREHNPEFTMLEFYWAYQDYEGLMEFSQELLCQTVKEITGSYKIKYQNREIDFTPPWPRLNFREALLKNCQLDVNEVASEERLLKFIKEQKIDLDLKGVVGYAPLLDSLYKKMVRPHLSGPVFLTDRPYQMVPLAKRKAGESSKSASFQLIVLGFELINAYDELNDPLDQRGRWQEETLLADRGLREYQKIDEDYLRALEYGLPPTAGWGLGIDRLVALLTDAHNLKEVILFPTLRPEKELRIDNSELINKDDGGGQKIPKNLPVEPVGEYPSREKVLEIVKEKVKNQNLFRHMLAVEAVMRALAKKFGGNQELWGILGLIHDADWEETKTDPAKHTRVTLDRLNAEGFTGGPLVQALKSHNRKHTQLGELESVMEWALETCDELTGFIVSVSLVRPEKKLASVTVDHILKKWKEKSFAAAVDRSQIAQCEEKLGIKLPEFIFLVLGAMQSVAEDLGL